MKIFRVLLIFSIFLIILSLTVFANYYYKGFADSTASPNQVRILNNNPERLKLRSHALELKKFALSKGFNSNIILLIDMSIPSGKNRFFIYDIEKDSVVNASLVAHGAGNKRFSPVPIFSNMMQSGCTSLGKYKIGEKYKGRFGIAYKLFGLDTSNSNAFKRNVVLHAYNWVPSHETYPAPICNSLGCAMVSPSFLQSLSLVIDASKRPMLLWIFK